MRSWPANRSVRASLHRSESKGELNQTIRHWYRLELLEETLPVCSERSRVSGEPEGQARRWSGGLRLCSDLFRPTATESTASEEVYESRVVRFRCSRSSTDHRAR